jgi:hypothetical protein
MLNWLCVIEHTSRVGGLAFSSSRKTLKRMAWRRYINILDSSSYLLNSIKRSGGSSDPNTNTPSYAGNVHVFTLQDEGGRKHRGLSRIRRVNFLKFSISHRSNG